MKTKTPLTDAIYPREPAVICTGTVLEELVKLSRRLERENAALRELTSTLGAPNHINIPVEKWRELREDKERLDSGMIRLRSDNGWGMVWCIHKGMDLRAAIDAARKEEQP